MDIKKANRAIKGAWIVGIIAGVATLVSSLTLGATPYGLSALIDVFIIFSLTFGIYKKNRACAVIFFIYFVGSKIFQLIAFGWWGSLPFAVVFSIFLYRGILGTFAYHRIAKAELMSKSNSEMDTGGTGTAK